MGIGTQIRFVSSGFWLALLLGFVSIFSAQAQTQVALDTDAAHPGVSISTSALLTAIETSSTVTFGQERVWKMTGPFGGDVASLAIDPRNSQRIFVGTNDGQLFRSTDEGVTWQRVKPGLNASGYALKAILFDVEKPNVLYVGSNQIKDAADDASGGAMFVSANGGDSWREMEALRGRSIRNLVQSSKEPNVLLVAARDGIYRTKDRGANWERITPENDPELRGFHSVGVDPRDSNVIYVGTWHRPWKTTDGGLTWKLAGYKENGVIDDSDVFSIRIDETNPDIVLISACSGIYRTTNAANDWTKIQGVPFTSRRTHTIYQHPTRPEMIFAGTTEGLWRTIDNGKNWALVSSRRQVINAVAVHPEQPDRVYIGTEDGGILISTNGGESFEPSNLGFINRQIRVVMHDRTERGRVYAGVIFDSANGGLFVSEDNGLTWQQSSRGMGISDVYSLQQSTERPETLYAGTNKGLYRSEDRGLSWAKVIKVTEPIEPQPTKKQSATPKEKNIVQKRSQTAKSTKATTSSKSRNQAAKKPKVETPPASPDETIDLNNQIYAIAQIFPRTADDGAGLIAATWDGLFITRDEKKGWKQLKFDNATYPYFNVVTTSRAVPGLILVGTVDGLFVSRDNGESFVPMPLAPTPRRVQSIVFDPREPATIYAGTNDGLFITNNGGQSWEQRGNGLRTSIDTSAVLVNPNNPDEIYVGDQRQGGLFHSDNKGRAWEQVDTSRLPSNRLRSLSADPFDASGICLGSFSGGVYVMNKQMAGRKRQIGQ